VGTGRESHTVLVPVEDVERGRFVAGRGCP
jgi:hypothetical protein